MSNMDMPTEMNGFDDFIEQSLKDWQTPGVAIAVIKGDKVVFSKGFGARNLKEGLPVDAQTLFPLASVTKAFTSASLALLVDRGLLTWDRPVKEYLPDFKLYDGFATERMTARDLLCHRCGLPRHDAFWYNSPFNREELFERLRYLEPNKDFRTTFQYNNLMFMVAGVLLQRLTGLTWEDFVRSEIFSPLGMRLTNISIEETRDSGNYSLPYGINKKQVQEIPFYIPPGGIKATGPAGSIYSNVEDMAKWLALHLNSGLFAGRQLISAANINETHLPNTIIRGAFTADLAPFNELSNLTYAMGWMVETYRGHTMIQHGGHIDGFSTMAAFLPEEKIGVVTLANIDGSQYPFIPTLNVFDRFLGLEPLPWSERIRNEDKKLAAASEKGKSRDKSQRVSGTRPSHPYDAYLGEYEHPGYGLLKIEKDEKGLKVFYNNATLPLKHYHYEVFEMSGSFMREPLKATFSSDILGKVTSVAIPFEPHTPEIVFKRKSSFDPTQLPALVGNYLLDGKNVSVTMRGIDSLTVSLPDSTNYFLEPYLLDCFTARGVTGVQFTFIRGEGEKVAVLEINQYGSILSAVKI
jgi:CubicO group peptidase (beta-lactamase class C family)